MEYKSAAAFLGLPIVHVSIGPRPDGRRGVAIGWLALGDVAFGVLASCGGVAVGAVSVGGVSLGVFPVGGLVLGLVALGGLSLGFVAVGGAAFAWHLAIGGLAIARDTAIGGLAVAPHVLTGGRTAHWPGPPEAPLREGDALALLALLVGLLLLARHLQERRNERLEGHPDRRD